jgi:hypothetical protein
MYIFGEDTSITPSIPGMRAGEPVVFAINGWAAESIAELNWDNDRDFHQADLSVTLFDIYLPLIVSD